ncbi:MAG: GDSL-type esterase/lipase family protein [Candidatus Aminicenantaceae bacterium]
MQRGVLGGITPIFLLVLSVFILNCSSEQGRGDSQFRIVLMGDSITKGVHQGVSVEHTFSARLQDLLTEGGLSVEVINSGVSGERTDEALIRLEEDVLTLEPDYVVIMYGTNDAFIDEGETEPRLPLEAYAANLAELVKRCRESGAIPLFMTSIPMGERSRAGSFDPYVYQGVNFLLEAYAEACRDVALSHDVPLCDLYAEWSAYAGSGMSIDRWMTDGVHPNPEGHGLIAKSLYSFLTEEIGYSAEPGSIKPPAYFIPTLDLADQKYRQVVVDREKDQYLGHPTTVLLEDQKTMIAVYPKGHGRGAVVMKRSVDAGLTWSERLPTPDNWATSQEVPTIHRVIDPQGLKRLIMFSGLYPIRMAVSEDDGLSWTPLSPIGDFGGIVAMGCVERLNDGDYLAMFHDDGRFIRNAGKTTGVFTLYKILSRDGGLSWSGLEEIIKGSRVHLCEPGILRSPDGNQLAVLLRENSRTRNSWVIFSDDEGLTWKEPRELPASLTGDRHTGRYAPDGRLFISFRDRTHLSPTWGDWVAWVGTYEDIVEGREGQYRVRLMDNTRSADCAYPGVEMLPDGTIITTTYGHWDEGEQPYVVSVRLRLAELDSMAAEGDVMAVERRLP